MEFEVRPTVEDDWEPYRDLRLEMLRDTPIAYLETVDHAIALEPDAWRDRVRPAADGSRVRFAGILPDGTWIGTMAGTVERARGPVLIGVYVSPKYRGVGRGVTSALLDAVEDWAARTSSHIYLDVHESNARAIAAYGRRGYVETGHTIPYPLDPSHLELEMIKQLR